MRTVGWVAACVLWMACISNLWAQESALEYPIAMLDSYDADGSCWVGMDIEGHYPEAVSLQEWLVGPPPSDQTAVTIAQNHWLELLFAGRIGTIDGSTVDIEMTEWGRMGEQAIVFLTDGGAREYPAALAKADDTGGQFVSYIQLSLAQIDVPFEPRAVRLVDVDFGGGLPGFDVGYIKVRVHRQCGPVARYPIPVDEAPGVQPGGTLVWTPACDATNQYLYLSDVRALVETGDPSCRYAIVPPDANSFEMPPLGLEKTYYWRVDSLSRGDVWSFTTADYLLVDDFDAYAESTEMDNAWRGRGLADVQLSRGGVFRSCRQSMYFGYFHDVASSSEACRHFETPGDWSAAGAVTLELWISGEPDNATNGQMYVALDDGLNLQRVFYRGDPAILTQSDWVPWRVPLEDFSDIDLSHVTSLAIGFRPAYSRFDVSGAGAVCIDDVALYRSFCSADGDVPGDVTADCAVDLLDLEQMALNWLDDGTHLAPVVEPNAPKLWYEFEGNCFDSAQGAHALAYGRVSYSDGVRGRAIRFASGEDRVVLLNASPTFADIHDAITVAFWLCADDSAHLNDTICCSNYQYGYSNPSIAINLGCWKAPGQYRWDCGRPWSFENRLAGRHPDKREWAGRWNHWAFTKDIKAENQGRMSIYLNGVLYATRSGTDTPIENVTSLELGGGWYGYYDGMMDDFRIYDYALSEAEVAYLASDGTGRLQWPVPSAADLDGSDTVDLGDFSILAGRWLDEALWP